MFVVTARKRSLGQGKVFTPVCHSVHRGRGSALRGSPPRGHASRGLCIWGSASNRGLHPGGVHLGGGAPRGVCLQGVFIQVVSLGGGVCIWGSASRGFCLQGVSIQGGLPPVGSASMGSAWGGRVLPRGVCIHGDLHPGGLHPLWEVWQTPPPNPRIRKAGSTHSTGMLSCLVV